MPQYKLKLGGSTMLVPEGSHEVGRSSDCWLTLQDELSSRVHARFHVTDEGCEIEDLGSRNGTYLNGERITGRRPIADGDRVRIGRQLMTILISETADLSGALRLRQTLAPGEQAGVPELMGQLIDKALKVGKTKDAERYANALHGQLLAAKLKADHPAARTGVECLLRLAEHTGSGSWIDKLFGLHAEQRWVIERGTLDQIRQALNRIPRIPGHALQAYEQCLRELQREGVEVSPRVLSSIGELVDAYGGR
ncbi:MAG: FHA domain-containing protein [Myxococcales bacterium]|nr:FHA domain-containing protein [Myxococcales bacterium]